MWSYFSLSIQGPLASLCKMYVYGTHVHHCTARAILHISQLSIKYLFDVFSESGLYICDDHQVGLKSKEQYPYKRPE